MLVEDARHAKEYGRFVQYVQDVGDALADAGASAQQVPDAAVKSVARSTGES